ncbi:MAG: SDR family oxidoreductase [Lacunisphaera sp.]
MNASPARSSGKIALVTGAGSGIGRAVARALLAHGWSVVLAGRRAEALTATARESAAPADRVLAMPTDVTDEVAVRALFAQVQARFGRLDLLFNNAGIGAPAVPLEELPLARWREVIDTNVTGVFLCLREAFRLMKQQQPRGGRIINNGSLSAHVPRPLAAPYNAAKHAVTGLTKSAALDGRPFGIACGQIDIGNADTALGGRMKDGALQASGALAAEPTFDVQHVADAVLYMAGLPLEANVPFLTVMATGMPYIGRG